MVIGGQPTIALDPGVVVGVLFVGLRAGVQQLRADWLEPGHVPPPLRQ